MFFLSSSFRGIFVVHYRASIIYPSALKITESSNQSPKIQAFTRSLSFKNYDKKIKLDPVDRQYRYDDNQFLTGPSWADEPYIKPTDDEIIELSQLKFEKDINARIEINSNEEPFNQVFEGQNDHGNFTQCEVVHDQDGSIWKWVEKLIPRQTLGPVRNGSRLIPLMNDDHSSSNLPYHVKRTRSRLYPIYRDYVVVDRDHQTYWQNRWDHMFNKYNTHILDKLDDIKWENNEKTIVITKVLQVRGDLWHFEEDARSFLQKHYDLIDPILTSVNEVNGSVQFKGDYIDGLVEFFKQKGF